MREVCNLHDFYGMGGPNLQTDGSVLLRPAFTVPNSAWLQVKQWKGSSDLDGECPRDEDHDFCCERRCFVEYNAGAAGQD